MTKILVKGDVYTVATKTECTVTSANGTPLGKATAGNPLSFTATTDSVELSDPDAEFAHVNPKCAPVASGNSSGGNEEQITALSRNVGVLSERVRAQATALNIFGALEGMMTKYQNVYYVETTLSLDVTSPTYFSQVLLRGVDETVEGTPFVEVTDLDGNATRYRGSRIVQSGTHLELFWDDLVPVANGYKLKITVEKAGKPVEFSVSVAINAGSYPVWELGYYTFDLMSGKYSPTTTTKALSAVMSFFYETKAADPTLYPVAPTMKEGIIAPYADSDDAVAIGSGAWASPYGVSIGANSRGDIRDSVAIGIDSSAGWGSTVLGSCAKADENGAVAVGYGAQASEIDSVTVGYEAKATADYAMALGPNATVSGASSVAVGSSVEASGESSVAVGGSSSASAAESTALGFNAAAVGESAVALGADASANTLAVALGAGAIAAPGGVAIGPYAQTLGAGMIFTYGNMSDFDQSALEGEIVFCGEYQPSAYEGIFLLRIVPAFSEASVALFDGKPGIMVANTVINDVGTVIENMVRGATFEELFPRDLLASTEATPAAMSLEDEPAPLNPVQQFMQMVATIQARKQAAADS